MIKVTEDDFSIDEAVERVKNKEIGALAIFLGIARGVTKGKRVDKLYFESYKEIAERELERIEKEAMEEFDVKYVEITHRIGHLRPGEKILLISCASSHREEAFSSCKFVLEKLKKEVPIWKKEIREDGGFWVV